MPWSSSPSSYSSTICAVQKRSIRKKKTFDQVLEPVLKAARWIPLSINPFPNLTQIIYAGISENDDEKDDEYMAEELLLHEDIMSLVPTFKDVLSVYAKDLGELDNFIILLTSTANAARQEDTATLKHAIIEYMILDLKVDMHHPPITKSQLKSMRGFSHTNTASALYPVKWMVEYLKDNVTLVNDGMIKIMAGDWPWFLYNNSEDLDLDEQEKGLC
ncbi:hypothetical protein L208DRAFT_1381676 [Tricholoma matsutake]|nr:hypothetical protein L208DRAFT_1381676 [Tricholoma matsutake 945]